MQLAPPRDLECVGVLRVLDAKRDIGVQFAVQAVTDVAGGHILSFLAGERTVIDAEIHRDGGLFDLLKCDRVRRVGRAYGVADMQIIDTGQGNNGADGGLLHGNFFQTVEFIQLCDAYLFLFRGIMMVHEKGVLVDADDAAVDLSDADPADIFIVIDG